MSEAETIDQQALAVRAFNRFYTRQIGLLNEGLLKSRFSLTEVRVLYELAHRDDLSASDIISDLGLDAGYLSRLLKKFQSSGLIVRSPSPRDARQYILNLTQKGRDVFAPLNQTSAEEITAMLCDLRPSDRVKMLQAMETIQELLSPEPADKGSFHLRPLQSGDIGWIAHRQGILYAREYGFDATFEALVAQIAADFVDNHNPSAEQCWIAERNGAILGSVFVVRQSDTVAKLRLLYVEPLARGLGLGGALVDQCIEYARARGYSTLTLWTNDNLDAAIHLYQTRGFILDREEKHNSFGCDLVGQHWNLQL